MPRSLRAWVLEGAGGGRGEPGRASMGLGGGCPGNQRLGACVRTCDRHTHRAAPAQTSSRACGAALSLLGPLMGPCRAGACPAPGGPALVPASRLLVPASWRSHAGQPPPGPRFSEDAGLPFAVSSPVTPLVPAAVRAPTGGWDFVFLVPAHQEKLEAMWGELKGSEPARGPRLTPPTLRLPLSLQGRAVSPQHPGGGPGPASSTPGPSLEPFIGPPEGPFPQFCR